MKVLIFTLLAVFALSGSVFAQQSDVALKVGQQKTSRASKLRIKFVSVVEDSRCPTDVNCVWAGNAKIKVVVKSARQSKEFEMNTTLGPQGNQMDGWAINLVSLTPSPTSSGAPNAKTYTAKFSITRLTR